MIITNKANLDLMEASWIPAIEAVQDDRYCRNLELTLTCGKEPWPIPEDAVPVIRYSKADGTGGLYDTLPDETQAWSVQGNVLTLALAPQVLTCPGMVSLAVTLVQGQAQISTFCLLLHVHPALDTSIAPSQDYYHVPGFLPAPVSAAAGQFFRIGAVDEQGHVSRVDTVSGCLPVTYGEPEGIGQQQNPADPTHAIWQQDGGRLAFGMDTEQAPVPFAVGGQLMVQGTLIAQNTGDMANNRWGYHVLEGYSTDRRSRLTLLVDKHENQGELYHYVGSDHSAASYGVTKIGSDVALHSFCFDRDKLTAYGQIDSKMPITLARISLTKDLNTSCDTVAEADAAWEPESHPAENTRCLKYLALKNAENGAMFYDSDRNQAVCKIGGKWCDLPFAVITDAAYQIFQDTGVLNITWAAGALGGYGNVVANPARIHTADFLPSQAKSISAKEGYEFCLLVLNESGTANNDCYYNPETGGHSSSASWVTSLDIQGIAIDGYPNRKIVARRTDLGNLSPEDGSNIIVT